jgi:predicted negative regulator of RcsB-dependent stress response
LRDIHVPSISWWPPAYGWWLLAAGVLVLLAGLAAWAWRARARRRYWRGISAELEHIQTHHVEHVDDAELAAQLSQLLRRAARTREPQAATARGREWQACIERLAPDPADAVALALLQQAMYQRDAVLDTVPVMAAARRWLRHVLAGRRA